MSGRHFLQIPGPTNVPDRVLRAIDRAPIDHRSAEFAELGKRCIAGLKRIFRTSGEVVIFTASGTGATEAALVNTLSPGDGVLMVETGHFAWLWNRTAERLGLNSTVIETDWRRGADAEAITKALREDKDHKIKAVCVVHNETSTGCSTGLPAIRKAIDDAGHPALLIVDSISGLGSLDVQMDKWGLDVVIAGSQKGLMLPPGMGFNGISKKALEAHKTAKLPRAYWDWTDMLAQKDQGFFPFTPATNLLFGVSEVVDMFEEEGFDNVFARHDRHGEATRAAVQAWGLETVCAEPKDHSSSLTAVMMPEGHSADALRKVILENFNLSLGGGLNKLADKVFRIGHLGWMNDLMLMGTLSGVEMGLSLAGVPHQRGGCDAAMRVLAKAA